MKENIKKVLLLGSGALKIGEAGKQTQKLKNLKTQIHERKYKESIIVRFRST